MEIELLFKITGIGILTAVVVQLLKQNGREELATIAAIVGLILGTLQMLNMLTSLMDTIRHTFALY